MNTPVLQSFIGGRWLGATPAQTMRSAINGRVVAASHAESIDFAEAVSWTDDWSRLVSSGSGAREVTMEQISAFEELGRNAQ